VKAAYKLCIRNSQQEEKCNVTNSLHDALINKNNVTFWKVWNSKFGNKKYVSFVINGVNDDKEIACNFAEYFAKTCNVNSVFNDDKFRKSFSDRFSYY